MGEEKYPKQKQETPVNEQQEETPVSELEKVATEIANQCVRSTLALIGGAFESALKTMVKTEDGSVRELNTREVLITITNTIGAYLENMDKAEQERNVATPKESN